MDEIVEVETQPEENKILKLFKNKKFFYLVTLSTVIGLPAVLLQQTNKNQAVKDIISMEATAGCGFGVPLAIVLIILVLQKKKNKFQNYSNFDLILILLYLMVFVFGIINCVISSKQQEIQEKEEELNITGVDRVNFVAINSIFALLALFMILAIYNVIFNRNKNNNESEEDEDEDE